MGFKRSIRPLGLDLLENPDTYTLDPDDFINLVGWWTSHASGVGAVGGASSVYGTNNAENVDGAIYVDTGTTNVGRGAISKNVFLLGKQLLKDKWRVALETLGSAGEDYTAFVGLFDQLAGTVPSYGVFFRYNYNVNGGCWECVCMNNSIETIINTTVLVDTIYNVFEIQIDETGTRAEFFINGASQGSTITNIPIANYVQEAIKIIKSAGTTSRKLHADWHVIKKTRTLPR